MTNLINIEKIFDKMPQDIQELIYKKIVYTQPTKLLEQIRARVRMQNFLIKYPAVFKSLYITKFYIPTKKTSQNIKELIYKQIVYTQPKELLEQIRSRGRM